MDAIEQELSDVKAKLVFIGGELQTVNSDFTIITAGISSLNAQIAAFKAGAGPGLTATQKAQLDDILNTSSQLAANAGTLQTATDALASTFAPAAPAPPAPPAA